MCQLFEGGACLTAYKKGNDSIYFNCTSVTAIQEIEDNLISVSPVPVTEYFNVSNNSSSEVLFTLTNSLSQKVLQFPVRSGESEIVRNSNLESGFYYFSITEKSRIIKTGKLVKLNAD